MTSWFHSARAGKTVGDGTVGDLIKWLEKLVNVLFPENGIEYWTDNTYRGAWGLKRSEVVPSVGCGDEDVHHVACYVHTGGSEGRIIEIGLRLRNGALKSITWAKSFGVEDECWQIARAVDAALDSIILSEEVPELVDMADKLPREASWCRETSLGDEVTVAATFDSLVVTTADGLVLDNRNWREKGDYAKFYVDGHVNDWKTVQTNTKARFKVVQENRVVADDLPRYTISDRGVEGCKGYYVLPPGGNPLDDRDYLGYFATAGKAVQAARDHRDGTLLAAAPDRVAEAR